MTPEEKARMRALEAVAGFAEELCEQLPATLPLPPGAKVAQSQLEEILRELRSGALERWFAQ